VLADRAPGPPFVLALDCSAELECLHLGAVSVAGMLTCFLTCGGLEYSHVVSMETVIISRRFLNIGIDIVRITNYNCLILIY
jgi:hypothetical protein